MFQVRSDIDRNRLCITLAGHLDGVERQVAMKAMMAEAGKRQSKRLEALKSAAFQERLKGDAADLALVASVQKEIHKAADTSAKAIRLESLYASATQPPTKVKKPERRRRPAKKDSGPKD
jgi:hypothetical protein